MRFLATIGLSLTLACGAVAQDQVSAAGGAMLRSIDKVTGTIKDIELQDGETAQFHRLSIELGQCRYPRNDPAGDAFAFLTIREVDKADPLFSGWMIASSPALNALDHPRYDVWVLRCNT